MICFVFECWICKIWQKNQSINQSIKRQHCWHCVIKILSISLLLELKGPPFNVICLLKNHKLSYTYTFIVFIWFYLMCNLYRMNSSQGKIWWGRARWKKRWPVLFAGSYLKKYLDRHLQVKLYLSLKPCSDTPKKSSSVIFSRNRDNSS